MGGENEPKRCEIASHEHLDYGCPGDLWDIGLPCVDVTINSTSSSYSCISRLFGLWGGNYAGLFLTRRALSGLRVITVCDLVFFTFLWRPNKDIIMDEEALEVSDGVVSAEPYR